MTPDDLATMLGIAMTLLIAITVGAPLIQGFFEGLKDLPAALKEYWEILWK